MTRDEAIAVLEEQRNFNRSFQHCFESQVDDISAEKVVSSPLAAARYKRIADALDMAIYALGEAERAFQDMVKSMPTCREPDWLPQGFGIAGYEQGGGSRQGLERHPEEGKRVYGMRKELSEIALAALRPVSRERVERMRGEWQVCFEDWRKQIAGDQCSKCGFQHYGTSINHYHFCPACGAPMTDEAVEMVMRRLEAMYGEAKAD